MLAWPGILNSERPQPSVADPPSELGDLWELLALGRVSTASRTPIDIRCLHFFFFSAWREILAWLNLIETQRITCMQACTHTHTYKYTEVASGVGRNLEKALAPEEFPWMACLQEQNNCSFIRSFHPSFHPSIYPGARKRWNLDWGAVASAEQCFPGTLKHVIFDRHWDMERERKCWDSFFSY